MRMVFINQISLINPQDDSYQFLNKFENDINAHSGINTVKKEMMVEQITQKRLYLE